MKDRGCVLLDAYSVVKEPAPPLFPKEFADNCPEKYTVSPTVLLAAGYTAALWTAAAVSFQCLRGQLSVLN